MMVDRTLETGAGTDDGRRFVVTPRLRLSPDTAVVGSEIALVATGFPPGEVKISLEGAQVACGGTDSKGTLYARFRLPPFPSGQYKVRAEPFASTMYEGVSAVLTVIPALVLSPSRGIGLTTVRGTGMAAGAEVRLFARDQELPAVPAAVATDRHGSFTVILTMPSDQAGEYEITAQTGDVTAAVTFTMVYPLEQERSCRGGP